ncbi:MAG: hypothetical protein HZB23_05240 [Deltaproteobacteria bacterium]|nr:hypothetical protein [Deltaproteobacteria bacterium]
MPQKERLNPGTARSHHAIDYFITGSAICFHFSFSRKRRGKKTRAFLPFAGFLKKWKRTMLRLGAVSKKNLWHRGCEFAPPTRRATEEYLTYFAGSATKLAGIKAQPDAKVFLETAPNIRVSVAWIFKGAG